MRRSALDVEKRTGTPSAERRRLIADILEPPAAHPAHLDMTDSKYHTPEHTRLEGRTFRPSTPAELAEAVELAFDYRGDITVALTSGERIVGYLFNREATGPRPTLQLYPESGGMRQIAYAEVASIAFSGEDTASGKSWEAWVTKKESERRAEAQRAEADARARGHL